MGGAARVGRDRLNVHSRPGIHGERGAGDDADGMVQAWVAKTLVNVTCSSDGGV